MIVTAHEMERLSGIRHGFLTRRGGVSDGIYDSLNCGLGTTDDRAHVMENRARAVKAAGLADAPLFGPRGSVRRRKRRPRLAAQAFFDG